MTVKRPHRAPSSPPPPAPKHTHTNTAEAPNTNLTTIYTYYCWLFKVDTYHVRDANGGGEVEAFRLIEYFDTWWFCTYAIIDPFYALFGPLLLVFSLPFYLFLRLVACLDHVSEEGLSKNDHVSDEGLHQKNA